MHFSWTLTSSVLQNFDVYAGEHWAAKQSGDWMKKCLLVWQKADIQTHTPPRQILEELFSSPTDTLADKANKKNGGQHYKMHIYIYIYIYLVTLSIMITGFSLQIMALGQSGIDYFFRSTEGYSSYGS